MSVSTLKNKPFERQNHKSHGEPGDDPAEYGLIECETVNEPDERRDKARDYYREQSGAVASGHSSDHEWLSRRKVVYICVPRDLDCLPLS
jgi:hypothetical protein